MPYFSSLFWICSSIFLLHQVVQKWIMVIPFLNSYLDDFLSGPIVMGIALFVQQQFTFRNKDYRFSPYHSLFFALWFYVLFEWIFPPYFSYAVSDIWDLAAYAAGAFVFHKYGNLSAGKLLLAGK